MLKALHVKYTFLISDPSQLWKLSVDGILKNKDELRAGVNSWQPDGNWTFTDATEKNWQNETLIHIKNNVTNMILTGFIYKAYPNETFVEGKHSQLWKRGQPDKEGYYTLQNFESKKLMTAEAGQEYKNNLIQLQGKCML